MKSPAILLFASVQLLFAQGPLDPADFPAPIHKSFQEIWDELQTVEGSIATQQARIVELRNQTTELRELGEFLHYSAGRRLPWTIVIVESGLQAGRDPSLAFGTDGHPAIAFQDISNSLLEFVRFDGSVWSFATVDSPIGPSSSPSLAFGTDGHPAISYVAGLPFEDLKFAQFDGSLWNPVTVNSTDDVGGYTSLAFDADGHPAISHHDDASGDLKIARHDGTNWTVSPVDSVSGASVGSFNSLAFGPDEQPAIACWQGGPGLEAVKLARFDGTDWSVTPIFGDGRYVSLAFGPDGHPAVCFQDWGLKNLMFARFDGSAWNVETVDSTDDVGGTTSLAFGPDGQPAIAYLDETNFALKFARLAGGTWIITTVDADGGVGFAPSLAFGPDGLPAIAYGGTGVLKYAHMEVFQASP